MTKIVNLASFWKTEAGSQIVLPDRSTLIWQKLVENAKIEKIKCDILSNFHTMWTRKISRPCGVNLEDLPPDHILTRFMRGGFSTLFFRKTCFFKRHEIFSRFLIRPVYCFKSIKCLSKIFCFDFFAIRLPVRMFILRLRESFLKTLR